MQITIVMPLRIAWAEDINSPLWTALDITSDLLFVIDVIINFLYV